MKKIKLPSLQSLVPQAKARKPMNKLQAHASRLTQSAYDDYEEPTTKLSTAFVVVLVLHLVAVGGIYAFHSIKAKRREADGTAVAAQGGPAATPGVGAAAPAVAGAAVLPLKPAPVTLPPVAQPPVARVPAPAPIPAVNTAQKTTSAPAKVENAQPHQSQASHLAPPAGPSAVIPIPKTPAPATTVAAKAQPPSVVPIKAVAAVPAVVPVAGTAAESTPRTYTVQKGDNPVAIAKRMGVNYEEMLKLNGIEDARKLQIGQVLKMPAKKQAN